MGGIFLKTNQYQNYCAGNHFVQTPNHQQFKKNFEFYGDIS